MKAILWGLLVFLLLLPAGSKALSASGIQGSLAAGETWQNQLFEAGVEVSDVSVAHGGPLETRLISYLVAGDAFLHLAHPMPTGSGGNCGGGAWQCYEFDPGNVNVASVSPLATVTLNENHFLVGWSYMGISDGDLYVYYREFDHDLNLLSSVMNYRVYEIPSGSSLSIKGRPAMDFDSPGYPRLAVVLHETLSGLDYLIHIYHTYTTNTSCNFASVYVCEEIETLDNISGYPVVQAAWAEADSRIAYVDLGADKLMFAYGWSLFDFNNCGPGDNSWRCITIMEGTNGIIRERVAMSKGQLLFSFYSTVFEHQSIMHAGHSGTNNCGSDWSGLPPTLGYRWTCTGIYTYENVPAEMWFALQVDENDYPVVAYNSGDTPSNVSVAFPVERAGGILAGNCVSGTWFCQQVNGGAKAEGDAGRELSLALNSAGLGFLTFLVEGTDSASLWTSQQFLHIYLPAIQR